MYRFAILILVFSNLALSTTHHLFYDCGCIKNSPQSASFNSKKINACIGDGNRKIIVPADTFYFSDAIQLKRGIKIQGESERHSVLIATTDTPLIVIKKEADATFANLSNLTLCDINNVSSAGIKIESNYLIATSNYLSFNNLFIRGFEFGLHASNFYTSAFSEIQFEGQREAGVYLGSESNNISFSHCFFNGAVGGTTTTKNAIRTNSAMGNGYSALHTLSITKSNLEHYKEPVFKIEDCVHFSISDCHIESNDSSIFYFRSSFGNINGNLIQRGVSSNLFLGEFVRYSTEGMTYKSGNYSITNNTIQCYNNTLNYLIATIGVFYPSNLFVQNNAIVNLNANPCKLYMFGRNLTATTPTTITLCQNIATSKDIINLDNSTWNAKIQNINIDLFADDKPGRVLAAKLICISSGTFNNGEAITLSDESGIILFQKIISAGENYLKNDEIPLTPMIMDGGECFRYIRNSSTNESPTMKLINYNYQYGTPRVKLILDVSNEGNF